MDPLVCDCGNPMERMRCPADWDAVTVAKWRALEERFTCDECEARLREHVYLSFPDYANVIYDNPRSA